MATEVPQLPNAEACFRCVCWDSLGRNVRRLRLEKGWSQDDYADRAEIHRTYVSDIERGRRNPTATVIDKLARPFLPHES